MATSFPLYDNLCTKIYPTGELSYQDQEFMAETIKNLSDREHELIYALIRSYQVNHTESSSVYIFPYNAKRLKKGIKFNIQCLPDELQHIILAFLKLHLELDY